ncbi:unnamed protein product [Urochloa humidicola]
MKQLSDGPGNIEVTDGAGAGGAAGAAVWGRVGGAKRAHGGLRRASRVAVWERAGARWAAASKRSMQAHGGCGVRAERPARRCGSERTRGGRTEPDLETGSAARRLNGI